MEHDTHPAPSLQTYTDQLNRKYGPDPIRLPSTGQPLTAQQLANLQQYQAEQTAKQEAEQDLETRLRTWVLKAQGAERSPASREAYEQAKKHKPQHCTQCQKEAQLCAHHVTPYAQLKQEGRHLDPAAHIYEWLCLDCHATRHPEVAHFIRATNHRSTRKPRPTQPATATSHTH